MSCGGCSNCNLLKDPSKDVGSVVVADLNPPLGKPGGPCQVVDRILKRVVDERLQKGLVNEVQQGEDLSNAEASKVYPIEAEPGVGPIHRIVITSHGQYRMDLRGITVDDVQAALASFVKQLAFWKALKSRAYDTFAGQLERQENVEWVDPRSKLKIVFVQVSPGTVRLITTFWRGQQASPPPRGTCISPRKTSMSTELVLRVAARFQRHILADGPWLPDLLGSKAHLVDEVLVAAKRIAAKDTWKKGDIKSICGGVLYFAVKKTSGSALADKLWNLLDSSGGLDAGREVEALGQSVVSHLDHGPVAKVQAAAIGISLLQRSKQPTKAQRANAILSAALKGEVDAIGDPGEKSKSKSAKQDFLEAVREQLPLARVVWGQLKNISKAAAVAWTVLEESNARESATTVEKILSPAVLSGPDTDSDDVREHARQVAEKLHWGIVEGCAFAVALMEVAGQPTYGRKLFSALLKEVEQYLGPGTLL